MHMFDVYPLMPLAPVSAEGCWVRGADGARYLDLYGGHAVISIGHTHPRFVERLRAQAGTLPYYSNAVHIAEQHQYAARLGAVSGLDDYALFLCNSGAEANENALKLAAIHTGRRRVLACVRAFHGRTALAAAVTDSSPRSASLCAADVTFIPLNDAAAFERALGDDVACVILEGVQGVGGVYEPEDDFLRLLRRRCSEVGALLLLDEVQSGCGRTGDYFAFARSGVRPDLISIAKGIGNGFPLAGVCIAPHIEPRHGALGSTFGGGPLACAAGLAVLDVLQAEDLQARAARTGAWLLDALRRIEGVREVRGRGLMIGFDVHGAAAPLRARLLAGHHIITGSASGAHTVRLLPPLCLDDEQAQMFVHVLTQELQKETDE
ncbi:MAG: aspartate aminotransferase family protein [Ignavibacteriae bacterium]|nr:aspartate aminotransferase family protein [Ignavibacteriota bacterium]